MTEDSRMSNEIYNKASHQQGIAKSGAERLRLDICARFNIRSSIEILCKKSPPSAIPKPLPASVKRHRHNRQRPYRLIKTLYKTCQMNRTFKTYSWTTGKPTHLPDPSVFFIFPTALFLIQFLACPHWHIGFCPDTQSQRFGKSQRANFADPQVRFSETNCIFTQQ